MVVMAAGDMAVTADLEVPRDVLPLPVGPRLDELLLGSQSVGLTGGGARKARRRRREEAWLREGVAALNMLGGRGVAPNEQAKPAACQVSAVRDLARTYGSVPPPPADHCPQRAYGVLLSSGSGYNDSVADGGCVTYRRGAASLPQAGAGRIPLESVLPAALQSDV